jgi:hypothetical protein
MNERIRECWVKAASEDSDPDNWDSQEQFIERFSKLIVRECIDIAQDRAAFDWAPPNDVNHIINEIKEHFGVA